MIPTLSVAWYVSVYRLLEIINERFARQFRMGLFNLLRRSPDITVGAIRIQPYHEFARNLPVPTNLNLIHLKPLRHGSGGVLTSLVFIAVDNLFGGDGRFPTKVEGREFTRTEQRVINRMLKPGAGKLQRRGRPSTRWKWNTSVLNAG